MRYTQLALVAVLVFGHPLIVLAVPDNTLSITPSATAGAVITAADENTRNNATTTTYNAHGHTDIAQVANTLNVGDNAAGNKNICANAADSTDACIRWNDTDNLWTVDNPTVGTFNQIATISGSVGLLVNGVVIGDGYGSLRTVVHGTTGQVLVHQGTANRPVWTSGGFFADSVIGSFTRDMATASGTQTVTGLGIAPERIFVICNRSNTPEVSHGVSNSTTDSCLYDSSIDGAANSWKTNDANAIFIQQTDVAGTNFAYKGDIGNFVSGAFDVVWTRTNTPTGTITCIYEALGD